MIQNFCSDWEAHYNAFIKVIRRDFPYELHEDLFDNNLKNLFQDVYQDIISQHARIQNPYFSRKGKGILNLAFLDHFLILSFRFGHALYKADLSMEIADALYYSGRIRTSTDIYYRAEIGDFFLPSHPIGTVLGSRATYGKGFRPYNGVHIGPFDVLGKSPSVLVHPVIGDGVIIFPNASIYGGTIIGNNVTISAGTTVINENVPDNCIVFGESPDLKVMPNKHDNFEILEKGLF